MCGICGKSNPEGVKREEIAAMMAAIIHRGPDDKGIYLNHKIGLGNLRLSIIDLETGHQPIANEDRTIWIVFNGEIYNYRELRSHLQQKGHIFSTHSDTEVIVHLYEEYGERCVQQLRGMFAFAIWDEKEQKLLLFRDRLGQKPLFYAHEGDSLVFASEIKAILSIDKPTPKLNYESLHHYLSLRFIPPPNTMLQHVFKLPPAHYLVYQNGRIRIARYWQLSFENKLGLPETELLEGLQTKMGEVIDTHLVSDVPVGAFLSGGMDSSMVAGFMSRSLDDSFYTFAVGVEEDDFNELPYARVVAEHFQTNHREVCIQSDIISVLPKMIWHLDEPSDPIAACQYYASELAAKKVKVVLGGDGGDELFAGFDRYLGVGYVNRYTRMPVFIRRNIVGTLLEQLPEDFSYKSSSQKLRWLNQLSLMPTTAERYAEATCFFRFNHQQKQALYGGALMNKVGQINSSDEIIRHYHSAPADNDLDRMLYTDYNTRLPEHSLMLTDRMTMAHGLELRSPFLDHELVSYLAAFPPHMKIRNRQLKYALRKIGREYLPEKIVSRSKQGFMFPVAYWFRNSLSTFLERFLLDSVFITQGLFRNDAVLKLIQDHRHNRVDNHVRLWMLLNLVIWHQIYIDGRSPNDLHDEMAYYLAVQN